MHEYVGYRYILVKLYCNFGTPGIGIYIILYSFSWQVFAISLMKVTRNFLLAQVVESQTVWKQVSYRHHNIISIIYMHGYCTSHNKHVYVYTCMYAWLLLDLSSS